MTTVGSPAGTTVATYSYNALVQGVQASGSGIGPYPPVAHTSILMYAARKPVDKLCGWPGSSWRFYFLDDASILSMDRML